jgi:hypothetical protein
MVENRNEGVSSPTTLVRTVKWNGRVWAPIAIDNEHRTGPVRIVPGETTFRQEWRGWNRQTTRHRVCLQPTSARGSWRRRRQGRKHVALWGKCLWRSSEEEIIEEGVVEVDRINALSLAKADWIVAQERDRACAAVRAFLDGQPLPREEGLAQLVAAFAERCSIVDGLLVVTERNHGGRRYEKVWVPEVLRYSALCQAHDDPATGGHVGVVKMLDRMDKDFFWPAMTTDV